MKLSQVQKKRAIEQMHELMLRMPLPQDVGRVEQCWTAAEYVVDSYIAAAEARASDLPPREQLGEACFHLISLVGLIRNDDNTQLVSELLTPEFGVEMYGLLPRVMRLRDQAVEKLTELAEKQTKAEAAESATNFDLF
ncbi:TPA: hypothetical protein ACKQEC_004859 [Pseudomonas aeruginosa]